MSWLSKGLGALVNVASHVNPVFGAGYDAVQGKGLKTIGQNFVNRGKESAGIAAQALPMALTGGASGALGSAGGFGGLLKSVGGFLGKNPELIGAGLGMLQGNKDQNAANKAYKKQEQFAMQRWNDTAPLRTMAMSQLQNTQRPDLSRVFVNPQNPFSDNRAAPLRSVGGFVG